MRLQLSLRLGGLTAGRQVTLARHRVHFSWTQSNAEAEGPSYVSLQLCVTSLTGRLCSAFNTAFITLFKIFAGLALYHNSCCDCNCCLLSSLEFFAHPHFSGFKVQLKFAHYFHRASYAPALHSLNLKRSSNVLQCMLRLHTNSMARFRLSLRLHNLIAGESAPRISRQST